MNLLKMMTNWYKRFECFSYWDDYVPEDGDGKPLINFSLECYFAENRPRVYSDSEDTNRWRYLGIRLYISKRATSIIIPFKPLPDYVPSGKAMLRTRKIGAERAFTKL